MNLIIDIDDTLAVTAPSWTELTEKYMKAHRIKRTRDKSQDTYYLEDSFGLSQEQFSKYRCYMFDELDYSSLPVVPGAKEFIDWVRQAGYMITFTTARPPWLLGTTEEWLSKNFELFERPYVMRDDGGNLIVPMFKVGMADVLIDNSELRCRRVHSAGGRAILFTGSQVDRLEESDISMLETAVTFEEVRKLLEEK